MNTITIKNFTDTIEKVVEEYGRDYVYHREPHLECKYQVNGEPSCLIGHVLERLDIPYDPTWEGSEAERVLSRLQAPYAVQYAADQAQQSQDVGEDWGEALDAFTEGLQLSLALTATYEHRRTE